MISKQTLNKYKNIVKKGDMNSLKNVASKLGLSDKGTSTQLKKRLDREITRQKDERATKAIVKMDKETNEFHKKVYNKSIFNIRQQKAKEANMTYNAMKLTAQDSPKTLNQYHIPTGEMSVKELKKLKEKLVKGKGFEQDHKDSIRGYVETFIHDRIFATSKISKDKLNELVEKLIDTGVYYKSIADKFEDKIKYSEMVGETDSEIETHLKLYNVLMDDAKQRTTSLNTTKDNISNVKSIQMKSKTSKIGKQSKVRRI